MAFEIKFEEKNVWCIWTKTGRRPTAFHNTRKEAVTEAIRLSKKHPKKKFLVMRVEGKFHASPVDQ